MCTTGYVLCRCTCTAGSDLRLQVYVVIAKQLTRLKTSIFYNNPRALFSTAPATLLNLSLVRAHESLDKDPGSVNGSRSMQFLIWYAYIAINSGRNDAGALGRQFCQ